MKDSSTPDKQYDNKEEKRVITGPEQDIARKNGEISDGEVTRKDHGMKGYIPVSDPTSTGGITISAKKNNTPKKNHDQD